MIYWNKYYGHNPKILGERKKFDNTIYTFDIETTSFLILNNKMIPAKDYLQLSEKERKDAIYMSNMYIWMFSINETVYYGRTWDELKAFMLRIETWGTDEQKIVYVHNLPYEFQFLRNEFDFEYVFARKSRKPIKFQLSEFNFEFRCSMILTNCKLEKLAETYKLKVKKLVGNLDYNLIRNSKTTLTEKELQYCENDCLVIYEYIKLELLKYKTLKKIPLTNTGHVRNELKEKIIKNYPYRNKVRKSINTDGHIYNLLISAFQGGYTHANWIYASSVINEKVKSYDFASSYPYTMLVEKFPSTKFKKLNIKKKEQLLDVFAYLIRVKFTKIECKYFNNFISASKCINIKKGRYDNGRIISADEIEIVLTDVDFKFIEKAYKYETYEFIEIYYSVYDYLPIDFVKFILDKYELKTKYKNVEGKEVIYAIEKGKFNALYGMSVTNNIKDNVIYDNTFGWDESKISNKEIEEKLKKEESIAFLSFSYGVWITAYARNNLLENIIQLDKNVLYADTDSIKVFGKYDENIITNYNKKVKEKIENVCKIRNLKIDRFKPKDAKGKEHLIGIFENDGNYLGFITQGAKKYAYIDEDDEKIHITVAGVPKKGARALKRLEDFNDDFVFNYEDTEKMLLIYNDEQVEFELEDYEGNSEILRNRYGACLVPTTYVLGKSQEYTELISDESSKRAIYMEVESYE